MAKRQAPSAPSSENGETSQKPAEDALPVRRSGRARKSRPNYDEDSDSDSEHQSSIASPSSTTDRRNPKRKAAPDAFDVPLPDNLLEASLGPWKENEQAEWPSWIELESDPVSCARSQTQSPWGYS